MLSWFAVMKSRERGILVGVVRFQVRVLGMGNRGVPDSAADGGLV